MAPRIKADISDEQYKAAISALENGATKKAACEILNIAYNTNRLTTLIETYTKEKENELRLRKSKRGTPVSDAEMIDIIERYFDGESMEEISKRTFRPMPLIKLKLEQHGAMLKSRKTVNPMNPPMIPDECVEEHFALKGHVWVAGYNCLGEIDAIVPDQAETTYRIYLLDRDKHRYVYYAWYELGSLRHLQALGLDVTKLGSIMSKEDRDICLSEALKQARMSAKVKGDK